jgi:hypothetical protein
VHLSGFIIEHVIQNSSSSSSTGNTAHCGLWPVEQYPFIFPYLSPSYKITRPIPARGNRKEGKKQNEITMAEGNCKMKETELKRETHELIKKKKKISL